MDGGRFVLWKVYFREEEEAVYFGKMLSAIEPIIEFQWMRNTYWGNEIEIDKNASIRYIILCFIAVFKEFRLKSMLRDTIETDYRYEEEAEMQQIMQWTISVLYEHNEVEKIFEHKSFEEYLFHLLYEKLHFVQKLHFDAIIPFCMKPLRKKLVDIVGYAIDEMRAEEAYQDHLQAMRTYVARREPKCERIYIVEEEKLVFFDEFGNLFSEEKLVKLMRKEPLYVVGLHECELTLSPILALLPKRIYIYCDRPIDTKIATIMNVFEERVHLRAKTSCPFLL